MQLSGDRKLKKQTPRFALPETCGQFRRPLFVNLVIVGPMTLARLQETKSTIRFRGKLFRPKTGEKIGSWALLTLPKNASAKLPSRGRTMAEGTINGFPFRAALEPTGKGSHWLRVNEAMQDAAGAGVLETVRNYLHSLPATNAKRLRKGACASNDGANTSRRPPRSRRLRAARKPQSNQFLLCRVSSRA